LRFSVDRAEGGILSAVESGHPVLPMFKIAVSEKPAGFDPAQGPAFAKEGPSWLAVK
jgi:hypothetical protein